MKLFILALFTMSLTACISTHVRDFTDPDYISFQSKKILIETPSHLFEESFSNELKNIDVIYASSSSIFIPTRTYTAKDKLKIMEDKGFDSLLTINISDNHQSSKVVGYNTSSYANAYSTGYGSAYASGTSTSIPIVSHNRNSKAIAKLYEVKTGRIIWVGNLDTSASGALYMSTSTTVDSMVEEIVVSLLKKRHLKKKQSPK